MYCQPETLRSQSTMDIINYSQQIYIEYSVLQGMRCKLQKKSSLLIYSASLLEVV